MDICKECNKRPVYIKKRQLCILCYGRFKRSEKNISPTGKSFKTIAKWQHAREIKFIKNYFNHTNWIYQPAVFYMEDEKYFPDFYDGNTNVFIEVVGTKQAYFQNKHKYELFRKVFPLIKFEVRLSSGELLNEEISINSQTKDLK